MSEEGRLEVQIECIESTFFPCECGHCVVGVGGFKDGIDAEVAMTMYYYSGRTLRSRLHDAWRLLLHGNTLEEMLFYAPRCRALGERLVELADWLDSKEVVGDE